MVSPLFTENKVVQLYPLTRSNVGIATCSKLFYFLLVEIDTTDEYDDEYQYDNYQDRPQEEETFTVRIDEINGNGGYGTEDRVRSRTNPKFPGIVAIVMSETGLSKFKFSKKGVFSLSTTAGAHGRDCE